jgi:hypothetical protein
LGYRIGERWDGKKKSKVRESDLKRQKALHQVKALDPLLLNLRRPLAQASVHASIPV